MSGLISVAMPAGVIEKMQLLGVEPSPSGREVEVSWTNSLPGPGATPMLSMNARSPVAQALSSNAWLGCSGSQESTSFVSVWPPSMAVTSADTVASGSRAATVAATRIFPNLVMTPPQVTQVRPGPDCGVLIRRDGLTSKRPGAFWGFTPDYSAFARATMTSSSL
ncbi:MAG: hypothetical protein GWN07_37015 [Actinobacteria bacterium]|nr:hypothetical protein [Actinomycetota bacterium]